MDIGISFNFNFFHNINAMTLFRMFFKEFFPPFVFVFLGLNGMFLLGRLLPMAVPFLSTTSELTDIFQFILLLLPTFWAFVIPMSVLFAFLIVMFRLSRDNELVALFSCGISIRSIAIIFCVFSLVLTIVSFYLSTSIVPMAKAAFKGFMAEMTEKVLAGGIPVRQFFSPVNGLVFYTHAETDNGKHMEGVFLQDSRRPDMKVQIMAKSGEILASKGSAAISLYDGVLSRASDDLNQTDVLAFEKYTMKLQLASNAAQASRGDLSFSELWRMTSDSQQIQRRPMLLTEFHKRLALPFSVLALGLLALPLGITFGRAGFSSVLALGLFAFLLYYAAMVLMSNLADSGTAPAFLLVWSPNVVVTALAGYFIYRLQKNGPLGLLK